LWPRRIHLRISISTIPCLPPLYLIAISSLLTGLYGGFGSSNPFMISFRYPSRTTRPLGSGERPRCPFCAGAPKLRGSAFSSFLYPFCGIPYSPLYPKSALGLGGRALRLGGVPFMIARLESPVRYARRTNSLSHCPRSRLEDGSSRSEGRRHLQTLQQLPRVVQKSIPISMFLITVVPLLHAIRVNEVYDRLSALSLPFPQTQAFFFCPTPCLPATASL